MEKILVLFDIDTREFKSLYSSIDKLKKDFPNAYIVPRIQYSDEKLITYDITEQYKDFATLTASWETVK